MEEYSTEQPMVDRRDDKKLLTAKKGNPRRYTDYNLKIEDIMDRSISPDEQLAAALKSDKQKRRQALPLPCKEVQINESTNHDIKQNRSLTIHETNLHQNVTCKNLELFIASNTNSTLEFRFRNWLGA